MHNNRHNRKTMIIPQTVIVPAKSIIVASLIITCLMVALFHLIIYDHVTLKTGVMAAENSALLSQE